MVAGGGPAALEAALTLNERLGTEARRLCLIAPDEALSYRPLSAVAEFATHSTHRLPLAEFATTARADLIHDRVALVDERGGRILTDEGSWVEFDYLLLAAGTSALAMPREWAYWPPEGDPALLRRMLDRGPGRVAVVVPADAGWPLAGYELALILAVAGGARVTLLTEDERPLAALGPEAAEFVDSELREAGIETLRGVAVSEPPREQAAGGTDWMTTIMRRLWPATGKRAGRGASETEVVVGERRMRFDRVLSLPRAHGPGIGGLHADRRRFIYVDAHGRVSGSERVFAAGDCTTVPLKHSTLAVAQADAAADALAAAAGAAIEPSPFAPTLTGVLVPGAAKRWQRENAVLPPGLEVAAHCLWWPPGRVLGGRLAQYVATRDPSARPLLLGHPHGIAVQVELELPAVPASIRADADPRALQENSINRQVFALRRIERRAEAELEHMQHDLDEADERGREVLGRLNAAGYVVKRS